MGVPRFVRPLANVRVSSYTQRMLAAYQSAKMPVLTSVGAISIRLIQYELNVSCLIHAPHWMTHFVLTVLVVALDVKIMKKVISQKTTINHCLKVPFLGNFVIIVGGNNGFVLDDVELISLDPVLTPVPDCLTQLNSFPIAFYAAAGALDYSGNSEF